MEYSVGKKVFKDWEIVRKIGEDGEKSIFELRRKSEGGIESALLYVIPVPGEAELEKLRKQSSNQKGIDSCFSLKEYYRKKLNHKTGEIARMALGTGTLDAGQVAEYSVQEHTEGIGWDILVRMEAVLVKDGQNEKNSGDKTKEVIQPQGSPSACAASAKAPKRRIGRRLRTGVVILLVLLAGVGVWWYFFSDARQVVTWSDPNMERLIRTGLDWPEGDIRAGNLADIRVLRISWEGVFLSEDPENRTRPDHEEKEFEYTLTLEDLKWMPKLQRLEIAGQKLGDLTPLGDLTNLEYLDLSFSDIKNVSALGNLTNLEHLSLPFSGISDISALGNLTNLTYLYLSGNDIGDVSALGNLTDLAYLYLRDNGIRDVSGLGNLTNLEELYLSGNDIRDISALGNLTSLEWLDLRDNGISDISALGNLTGLEYLYLSGNGISDISALGNLTDLRMLYLRDNDISDLSALEGLNNLQELYLTANESYDDSMLDKLGDDVTVYVYENSVSE